LMPLMHHTTAVGFYLNQQLEQSSLQTHSWQNVWPISADLSGHLLLVVSSSVSFNSCSFHSDSSSNFISCSCAISQSQKSFVSIVKVYTLFFIYTIHIYIYIYVCIYNNRHTQLYR
jgi:hypothetical protein